MTFCGHNLCGDGCAYSAVFAPPTGCPGRCETVVGPVRLSARCISHAICSGHPRALRMRPASFSAAAATAMPRRTFAGYRSFALCRNALQLAGRCARACFWSSRIPGSLHWKVSPMLMPGLGQLCRKTAVLMPFRLLAAPLQPWFQAVRLGRAAPGPCMLSAPKASPIGWCSPWPP